MEPFTTTTAINCILILLLIHSATAVTVAPPPTATSPTSSPPSSSSSSSSSSSPTTPLDPKQITALQSLYIPTTTHNPCTQPSFHNATVCDTATPFRHVINLRLTNCSSDLTLSTGTLSSLSTLTSLSFINCHVPIVHFPSSLSTNLRSFTSINSLNRLTGVFLSRFRNLTQLQIIGDTIRTSGIHIITSNIKSLNSLTLSNANISGLLPRHWNSDDDPKLMKQIDLSQNRLNGTIPTSLTLLENLELLNLSSNQLSGEIPVSFGDLASLTNVSLASNALSGSIPGSLSSMSRLVHLDLSSNSLNGSIPRSISEMKGLKYLNLEKNNFHGVMPFNASFIKRLTVFKISGNDNLCYNHSSISKKVKLGIAPCDKHGLPIVTAPVADGPSSAGDLSSDDYSDDGGDDGKKKNGDHGPNKVVVGVAITLAVAIVLIIFLVMLSKCCGGRCCCC